MLNNPIFLLGLSTLFASIPVGIWLYLIFRKGEKSKKIVLLVFLIGCLTAPALLGLQYLWDIFPNFNLAAFIEKNIHTQSNKFIAIFLLFAALEEILKMYVIIAIDKRTVLINTIGDAIRYSVASALAFSFIENSYYLYVWWAQISVGELVGMYIFRSIFTTCGHMVFSGIFGYHYGIGKFSMYLTEQSKISGKKDRIANLIGKIFKLPRSHAFQQKMILKGVLVAILIHVIFNYTITLNIIPPVIIAVLIGYLYLNYLLKRKAGHLILEADISESKRSTMPKKDEDVVIELMGMWFNDKRYVDVIHVCERLLERDPDNQVVKIFKARAMDKLDDTNIYKKILGTVIKSKEDIGENEKNILTKYIEEKEKIKKNKESENPIKKEKSETPAPKKREKDILKKYTEGTTFEIKN